MSRRRVRPFFLNVGSNGYAQFYPGQIDVCPIFVRGVVTHPEHLLMPGKAGVACVAAGRKGEKLPEFAVVRVEPVQ